MKGIIPICLKDMIMEKYGSEKWEECLKNLGADADISFLATSDVHDGQVMKLIDAACKALGISVQQAADAFGEYWVCIFSQKIYSSYYRMYKNAREFLLAMDKVHFDTTKTIENSSPPRFDYEWKNNRTLIMTYNSKRNLIDFAVGLVKGVGKHYRERIEVSKVRDNKIQIVFEK